MNAISASSAPGPFAERVALVIVNSELVRAWEMDSFTSGSSVIINALYIPRV